MLTVDFDRLRIRPGDLLLDLGAGTGRHCFEALRRGARVVALDLGREDLAVARDWMAAMSETGEATTPALAVQADALRLPFAAGTFDHVVISEVLEHIPSDVAAITELCRVLKPGGTLAASVPRWWPEKVCWALSDEYHANLGGHCRVYRASELRSKLEAAGVEVYGSGFAHALHAPYWWLKCAVGARRDDHPLPRTYHRLLVWDIVKRPRTTRYLERLLNPVLGKSVVLYGRAPAAAAVPATAERAEVALAG